MKKKFKIGIIAQISILFVLSVIATGTLTYFLQQNVSYDIVQERMEESASRCAQDAMATLREYPAYKWLIKYWYEHSDEMDIEYDVDFSKGTDTEKKVMSFKEKYPDIDLNYAEERDITDLPSEDQKTYAEIIYSWVITRINRIKRIHDIDFLFVVVTNKEYEGQFFLLSGADVGATRGTDYEDVYILGTEVTISESQREAMRSAKENNSHFADAGAYVDYYAYFTSIGKDPVLVGITYSMEDMLSNIKAQTWTSTAMAVIYQILISAICLLLVYFFILRPLKKIHSNIKLYKETKDSQAVKENLSSVKLHNELGQLSDGVVDMTGEIDEYLNRIESITAEREKIAAELSLASRIQTNSIPNIFPPFPDKNEFDIYASMDPAKAVGGDFYDFFLVDDDHLALLIADVSGKGIPAALFMMVSMVIIHNTTTRNITPSEILEQVNNRICERNPEEMFVSVWLGILEISTGKLTAANAGHEYPLIKHANGRFEVLKDKHGFVIGGMPGLKYTDYTVNLEPGSKILVYTDGVPEATNADKELFGLDRLTLSANAHADESPEDLLKSIRDDVDEFVKDAEQFDDLTMMCIKYIGK